MKITDSNNNSIWASKEDMQIDLMEELDNYTVFNCEGGQNCCCGPQFRLLVKVMKDLGLVT